MQIGKDSPKMVYPQLVTLSITGNTKKKYAIKCPTINLNEADNKIHKREKEIKIR